MHTQRRVTGLMLGAGAVFAMALATSVCGPGRAMAADKADKLRPQTNCPIMNGKIDKKLFVDKNGKRIYACCPMCLPKIKADFAGAVKKLAAKGQKPEIRASEQKLCPVMGGKINKKLFVEHNGKKIYACCPTCLSKIKADPDKYAKKVAAGMAKAAGDEEEGSQHAHGAHGKQEQLQRENPAGHGHAGHEQ